MRFLRKLDGLKVMTFVTIAASLACVGFVWYLWGKFDIKSQALARNGSDAAEYSASPPWCSAVGFCRQ